LPDSVDYARERAHITLAHVRGAMFEDVRVVAPAGRRTTLFRKDVEDSEGLEVETIAPVPVDPEGAK
jgi:hypothetical protein